MAGIALGIPRCGAAQTLPAPPPFTYTAANLIYRANGVRLEGTPGSPARIHSQQIDVAAPVIAFDVGAQTVSEVRATGGVKLRLELVPKNGGAPAHIESTSDNATLITADRKLILTGHVNGFYQVAGGPRENLVGEQAILTDVADVPSVSIDGGAEPLLITLPAESTDKPGAFGAVRIASMHFVYDGTTGLGQFTGSPHAVSDDGPNKFDVTANQFVLKRSPLGTIDTLEADGHAVIKMDLPPEPEKTDPAVPATPPTGAAANGEPVKKKAPAVTLGRPTHVESVSDTAVVDRAASTLTLNGHVNGFYRLSNVDPPQDYHFSGDKAVLTDVPVQPGSPSAPGNPGPGLNVQLSSATVNSPGFNLGF